MWDMTTHPEACDDPVEELGFWLEKWLLVVRTILLPDLHFNLYFGHSLGVRVWLAGDYMPRVERWCINTHAEVDDFRDELLKWAQEHSQKTLSFADMLDAWKTY